MESTLSYKRVDVYPCAIEFLALAAGLVERVPRGYASLADPLRRASLSIPLNIAEGAGKSGTADRRRFTEIARGSAMECAAILDACRVLGAGAAADLQRGELLLTRVVANLHEDAHVADHGRLRSSGAPTGIGS